MSWDKKPEDQKVIDNFDQYEKEKYDKYEEMSKSMPDTFTIENFPTFKKTEGFNKKLIFDHNTLSSFGIYNIHFRQKGKPISKTFTLAAIKSEYNNETCFICKYIILL